MLVFFPARGQQLLQRAETKIPSFDITSIAINHPDTAKIIREGVGENWPQGRQDTARWNSAFKKNILFSCDLTRNLIIGKAIEYLGVLYRYGQSSEKGFDCSGYVMFVFKIFGFTLPHSSIDQYVICRHLKAAEAKPGDLVFFRTQGNLISHVGIYLGDNTFIHAPGRGKRVTTESLNSPYYKHRFVGFGSVL